MNPLLPGQPLKVVGPVYDVVALVRELTNLHGRINSIIQSPALVAPVLVPGVNPAITPAPFAAGDVGNAAAIAVALNKLSAAINANAKAVNGLLAVFNSTKPLSGA